MDAGDCGSNEVFNHLYGALPTTNGELIQVPVGVLAAYVNLSSLLLSLNASSRVKEQFEIVDAIHNSSEILLSAIALQKEQVLIVVASPEALPNATNISFLIRIKDKTLNETMNLPFVSGLIAHGQQDVRLPFSHTLTFKLQFSADISEPPLSPVTNQSIRVQPEEMAFAWAWAHGHRWNDPDPEDIWNGTNVSLISNSSQSNLLQTCAQNQTSQTEGNSSGTGVQNQSETNNSLPTSWQQRVRSWSWKKKAPPEEKLDHYGSSLAHVNRLLSRAFGPTQRYVPAHMAHFLQTEVIEDMMKFWPDEWERCSAAHLRFPEDMQYALAYYYFLINQPQDFDLQTVFNTLDCNNDGFLDSNEIRTVITQVYEGPAPSGTGTAPLEEAEYRKTIQRFYTCAQGIPENLFTSCQNCSNCTDEFCFCETCEAYHHSCTLISNQSYFGPISPNTCPKECGQCSECEECSPTMLGITCSSCQSCSVCNRTNTSLHGNQTEEKDYRQNIEEPPLKLTLKLLLNCPDLLEPIETHYKKSPKRKTNQVKESPDVGFVMVGTNHTDVRRALDGLRKEKPRFICLNDNMNHSDPESLNVVRVLRDFYESLLPIPSAFELKPGTSNPYRYLDELNDAIYPTLMARISRLGVILLFYSFVIVLLVIG